MSRVGKKPISIPGNVKVTVKDRLITVASGNNSLNFTHRPEVDVTVNEEAKEVVVTRKNDERMARALHGTTRALIQNMITGVTTGFIKELDVVGVGWTAKVQGQKIILTVGYADDKIVEFPPGVKVEFAGSRIKVSGSDRQQVGMVAAKIRDQRRPEPYNGKGIKYVDEVIVRKSGKAFAGGG